MGKRGRPRHPDVLTPREWEVLDLLRADLSNDEIAGRLGISVDGVKYHVSEILSKLGLDNRADAARWRPERRGWALAPLALLRPRWLSAPIAAAAALAVVLAAGFLVWALIITGDGNDASGTPVPVALAPGDRLAYIGADHNLWLLDGGGLARRLTDASQDGLTSFAPQWSPDGRYILFLRATYYPPEVFSHPAPHITLWTADVLTGDIREVPIDYEPDRPADIWSARWSPDGTSIAFLSQTGREPGNALWVTDLDGNVREIVAPDFGLDDFAPFAWSPDGTKIALARTLDVVYPDTQSTPESRAQISGDNGVYVVDVASGEIMPVALRDAIQRGYDDGEAREGREPFLAPLGVVGADYVEWSPDGAYVAFQASVLSASASAGGEALFTVDAAGGAPVYHGKMLRSAELLDWVPGTHRFAFTLGFGRDAYLYKCLALAEAGVPGAQVPQPGCAAQSGGITPDVSVLTQGWPAVSPDGAHIAYQVSEQTIAFVRADIGKVEGAREGIWAADADGANAAQLTSDAGYLDFAPRWSADGSTILFVRLRVPPLPAGTTPDYTQPAASEVWLMRADGTGARPLATDMLRVPSYYGLFDWETALAWWRAPAP